MLGGSSLAVMAGERALAAGSRVMVRADVLLPTFLCPAVECRPQRCLAKSTPGPSYSSRSPPSSQGLHTTSSRQSLRIAGKSLTPSKTTASRYSSHAAVAAQEWAADAAPTRRGGARHDLIPRTSTSHHTHNRREAHRSDRTHSSPDASSDWTRKYPSTRWRAEMDFNRYSPPLRRRQLPEDAPALYEDEIKASSAWLPESQWKLSLPDDYPLRHELLLILDSLDDIAKNHTDPDSVHMLTEAIRQARELIWTNPTHPLRRPEDRQVALYLAGKVAETHVKLDAEDSLDQLMAFLGYAHKHIGPLPLVCFHALAAQAGMMRRYAAVLRICHVAEEHSAGHLDAELLHLRLRALIAKTTQPEVTRYWEHFEEAQVAVPRKTFDLLLRTHVRQQDVAQVNEVLEAMPKHGYEVDARAWLTILRGFQSFRPMLAVMLRRNANIVQSPTLDVVNRLLTLLARELDVDGVMLVLRVFRIPFVNSRGRSVSPKAADDALLIQGPTPKPDAQTYAILTGMLGRLGRDVEALAFFRLALSTEQGAQTDMARAKSLQQASVSVTKALLNAGHPNRAMRFASEVTGLPSFDVAPTKVAPPMEFGLPSAARGTIAPSSAHYRVLLNCTAAIGTVDGARRVLVHLLQQGHHIDTQVLLGLARVVFTSIDADALESIRLVRNLLSRDERTEGSQRRQREQSLASILRDLGVSDRIVLASQHSTDLQDRKVESGKAVQGSKTAASVRSGGVATKDELRDWLIAESSSLLRDSVGAAESDGDGDALDRELRRPLSAQAYALRIRVYAVVRRDHESARKVYQAMLAHGVQPNMMHVAPLVEGLTASGRLAEAQQLKHNAREVIGCEPTLRIHTALIQAYVRAGDSRGARKELQELMANGHEIDDTITNIIEAAQAARGQFALAEQPVNTLKTHNVTTRFHTLMRMRRYLDAQELVQSALDKGLRPDNVLHDGVRRSAAYLNKQCEQVRASRVAGRDGVKGIGQADGPSMKQLRTLASDEERRAHVHELTRAASLAEESKLRIAKTLRRRNLAARKTIKEQRKKTIQLILDFADGKLHDHARASACETGKD